MGDTREQIRRLSVIFRMYLEGSERTHSQAEIAREIGGKANPKWVRGALEAMQAAGIPLEREEREGSNSVDWTLPNDWGVGGVRVRDEDLMHLLQLTTLSPLPIYSGITARLRRGLGQLPHSHTAKASPPFEPAPHSQVLVWFALQDAIEEKKPVEIQYFTQGTQAIRNRVISPQKLTRTSYPAVFGWCHRDNRTKTFVLRCIYAVGPAKDSSYTRESDAALKTLYDEHCAGYHDAAKSGRCWLLVHETMAATFLHQLRAFGADTNVASRVEGKALRIEFPAAGGQAMAQLAAGLGKNLMDADPKFRLLIQDIQDGLAKNLRPK